MQPLDTIGYRFGSMNIAEISIEVRQLTLEQKRQLLARFVWELTIVGRGTYVPESDEVAAPRQLRAVNEIQHRVPARCSRVLAAVKTRSGYGR